MQNSRTLGQALADPASPIHRKLARADAAQRTCFDHVARRIAEGASAEQAWAEVVANARPVR